MANLLILITLVAVLVTSSSESEATKIVLPKFLNLTLLTDPSTIAAASLDYGNITTVTPSGVICPSSSSEISRLLLRFAATDKRTFQIAARGQGHSLHGQASVSDGIIINMTCLNGVVVSEDKKYADVAAGTLLVDMFKETTEKGVSPVSWTDYLHISVGGTLSNAGIGGQVFRHGPLISNVLELEVIAATHLQNFFVVNRGSCSLSGLYILELGPPVY